MDSPPDLALEGEEDGDDNVVHLPDPEDHAKIMHDIKAVQARLRMVAARQKLMRERWGQIRNH
jgi:hypothetical protein